MEGSRVLHHIKMFAPDARNTIVLPDIKQLERGADMIGGRPIIKIFGEEIPVQADVEMLTNMSRMQIMKKFCNGCRILIIIRVKYLLHMVSPKQRNH